MKRFAKIFLAACVLSAVLVESGCVYYPARPYGAAVWVPAHWSGDVWVRGHWR